MAEFLDIFILMSIYNRVEYEKSFLTSGQGNLIQVPVWQCD